jgi:hypothetical protein
MHQTTKPSTTQQKAIEYLNIRMEHITKIHIQDTKKHYLVLIKINQLKFQIVN